MPTPFAKITNVAEVSKRIGMWNGMQKTSVWILRVMLILIYSLLNAPILLVKLVVMILNSPTCTCMCSNQVKQSLDRSIKLFRRTLHVQSKRTVLKRNGFLRVFNSKYCKISCVTELALNCKVNNALQSSIQNWIWKLWTFKVKNGPFVHLNLTLLILACLQTFLLKWS